MQHSPGGLPARRLYPALVAAEIEPLERHAVAIGRVEEVEIAVAGDRGDGEILGDVPIGAQRGLPELVVLERTEIRVPVGGARVVRSEEHTSELQSLMRISYAVFCLKKKKDN